MMGRIEVRNIIKKRFNIYVFILLKAYNINLYTTKST